MACPYVKLHCLLLRAHCLHTKVLLKRVRSQDQLATVKDTDLKAKLACMVLTRKKEEKERDTRPW